MRVADTDRAPARIGVEVGKARGLLNAQRAAFDAEPFPSGEVRRERLGRLLRLLEQHETAFVRLYVPCPAASSRAISSRWFGYMIQYCTPRPWVRRSTVRHCSELPRCCWFIRGSFHVGYPRTLIRSSFIAPKLLRNVASSASAFNWRCIVKEKPKATPETLHQVANDIGALCRLVEREVRQTRLMPRDEIVQTIRRLRAYADSLRHVQEFDE